MRILAIAGAILLGALLIFVGAFGARWLVPTEAGDAAPAALAEAPVAAPGISEQTLGELLAVLDAQRRSQILESEENFEKFVAQEKINQSVLTAAYANGAEKNEAIRVLMERAGQRVLAEAYLNQVVRLNLDPEFPSAEQVREAYDNNPDVFRVPERMHMWQIFLPLDAAADGDASKAAWQQADRIVADLRANKASFEAMAKQHSAHQASRMNDGYMGLIKVSDLLPPIAEAVRNLPEGGIGGPIATETGLHIIKRGAVVAEETVAFDAVAARVRQRLVREAALKVRQAAVEKIVEEYPVEAPAADIEGWRESLRSQQQAAPVAAPAAGDG